jgi:hypothetical protein
MVFLLQQQLPAPVHTTRLTFVTNINPFQIINAEKTIIAKFSSWNVSIRLLAHSFFSSITCLSIVSRIRSIMIFVFILFGLQLEIAELLAFAPHYYNNLLSAIAFAAALEIIGLAWIAAAAATLGLVALLSTWSGGRGRGEVRAG